MQGTCVADGQWLGLLDHLVVGNASPVADGTWLLLLDDVVGHTSPAADGPWLLLLDDVAGNAPLVAATTTPPSASNSYSDSYSCQSASIYGKPRM